MQVQIELSDDEVRKAVQEYVRKYVFFNIGDGTFLSNKVIHVSAKSYSGLSARVEIEDAPTDTETKEA